MYNKLKATACGALMLSFGSANGANIVFPTSDFTRTDSVLGGDTLVFGSTIPGSDFGQLILSSTSDVFLRFSTSEIIPQGTELVSARLFLVNDRQFNQVDLSFGLGNSTIIGTQSATFERGFTAFSDSNFVIGESVTPISINLVSGQTIDLTDLLLNPPEIQDSGIFSGLIQSLVDSGQIEPPFPNGDLLLSISSDVPTTRVISSSAGDDISSFDGGFFLEVETRSIPEPSTALLSLLGACALLHRRR